MLQLECECTHTFTTWANWGGDRVALLWVLNMRVSGLFLFGWLEHHTVKCWIAFLPSSRAHTFLFSSSRGQQNVEEPWFKSNCSLLWHPDQMKLLLIVGENELQFLLHALDITTNVPTSKLGNLPFPREGWEGRIWVSLCSWFRKSSVAPLKTNRVYSSVTCHASKLTSSNFCLILLQ